MKQLKNLQITVSVILCLCAVMGLTSCKKDKNPAEDGTTQATTTVPETTAVADTKPPVTSVDPGVEMDVKIFTETFENGESTVRLSYPKYDDGEHDLFDTAMRSYAVQKYSASGMMPEDDALYEVTLCEVKYESEILVSAVVAGQIINTTTANDGYFSYTVNADPRTGRIYLSEELIGDLELIKGEIGADGGFTQTLGIGNVFDEINPEDITISWRSDYGIFPNMYFTANTFGVMAELPYALGGYAGFEIPHANMGNMVNETARALCGLETGNN